MSGLAWEKAYLESGVDGSVNSQLFETPYSYSGYEGTWDTIMVEGTWNGITASTINSLNYHANGGTGSGSSWRVQNSETAEPWVLGTFEKVPEPGTYAMLCGLGLVGAAWYRRRQRKS